MNNGTLKARRVFEPAVGGSWGGPPGEGDVDAKCVRGTDLLFDELRINMANAPLRSFSHADIRNRSLRPGDIVIEKSGGGEKQPVGRVGLVNSNEAALPTNFAGRLRPVASVEPRFVCYSMASLYFDGRTTAAIKQTTGIQNLDVEQLLASEIWLPPLAEQRAIADYLDAETARIDALITKKQQLIHLLEERWIALQERKLENGLVEYSTVALRHIVTISGGLTLGGSNPNCSITRRPYLRVANVQDGFLDLDEIAEVDVAVQAAARFELRSGDVLMLEGNGNPANLGRGTIWRGEIEGCLHQNHVHSVRADRTKIDPEYLNIAVRAPRARSELTGGTGQVSIATLSKSQIADLRVPLPPLEVQQQIADEMKSEQARLELTRSNLGTQIELLSERRAAIVTAAVTGHSGYGATT